MLFPLFFAAVYLSHITLLRLPYFWDEAGYYIPAAWDFYRTGSLIPQTTLTNAHPPLPSILLAAWWHLSGFVVSGTRTLVVMITAAALLAVYKLGRSLLTTPAAIALVVLTAIYPIWFAQSTLAHADIFAACFTLWGLALYLDPHGENQILASAMFSFAALSKETAIVTPVALALYEASALFSKRTEPKDRRYHALWIGSLLSPIIPLAAWYAFHRYRTGFIFGNPEFLRYNATANFNLHRIALSLWHRLLHLVAHMNMFVPVVCAIAALLIPLKGHPERSGTAAENTALSEVEGKHLWFLPRRALAAILIVLITNWIAFSILGGALLTRYLLPMYPLVLLVCIAIWQRHLRQWIWLAALTAAAFLSGIWINPPYAFAPEDNLTYRDMIVLHQQAIHLIESRFPQATVLSAWPATAEMSRPELGYIRAPLHVTQIENFSFDEMQKAAADPGAYDTALVFSTKWEPPANRLNLGKVNQQADSKYFDFHHDLTPHEAAALLHGEVIWQAQRKGEWAAVLRFPRAVEASLTQ
jgi:4-amino-4-deoxy-L-arabinose transferase-like glycosyltransferase